MQCLRILRYIVTITFRIDQYLITRLNKMSLKILLNDQIDKLFKDSPELDSLDKNKFEIAVASFANVKYLNSLEVDDLVDGICGDGGDEGIDLCYLYCMAI